MTVRRVSADTRRGFYALLVVSLLLHLVLTPLAGLVGFLESWLTRPDAAVDEGPQEQLREIPIELFEDEVPAEAKPDTLPEEDPVAMIDQLVDLPVEPAAPQPVPTPKPAPAPRPAPKVAPGGEAKRAAEPDAGAPSPAAAASPTTNTAPPPVPSQSVAAAPTGTQSSPPPEASASTPESTPPSGPPIDSPIALAGKGAKLIEKQTSVGLVLYMDRVRSHPLGKRIATLLPKLPQWDEFFGKSRVNPVDDFDRMFLLGPSFADSSGLVMAIEYNTSQDEIRGAVNGLVKQRGSWMTGAKVPTAITFADRAERVILFPAPKVVVIVPPHLREQAQKQGVAGVPKAKGPEAMVASTVNPAKALRRFGLDVPSSLQSAKIRITPLDGGRVQLELEALDESADKAQQTAALLTRQVNGMLDVVRGVGGVFGRLGFGGLAAAADLPRISLEADGKTVKGRQVLSQAQVAFLLDRVERELNMIAARRATKAEPALPAPAPKPPKTNGR